MKGFVAFLEQKLSGDLCAAYDEQFEDSEIRHFNDYAGRKHRLYFDCNQDYESEDPQARAARVVFIHARSAPGTAKRDSSRMRQFLGLSKTSRSTWVTIRVVMWRIVMTARSIKIYIRN